MVSSSMPNTNVALPHAVWLPIIIQAFDVFVVEYQARPADDVRVSTNHGIVTTFIALLRHQENGAR